MELQTSGEIAGCENVSEHLKMTPSGPKSEEEETIDMSIIFLPSRTPDAAHSSNRGHECWGTGHGPSRLPLPPPAATSAPAGGQRWSGGRRAVPVTCAGVGDAALQPGEEDGLEEVFLYLGACI